MTTVTDPSAAPAAPLAQEESRGFSLSSLVLGIIALQREPASRTMAIWGIVLNGVMLAGAVLAGLVGIAFGLAVLPFLPFAFA